MVLFITLLVVIATLLVNVQIGRVLVGDLDALDKCPHPCRYRSSRPLSSLPDVSDLAMSRCLGLAAAGHTQCCTVTWPSGDCLWRLALKRVCVWNVGACCARWLHPEQPPSKHVEVSVLFSGRPHHELPNRCPAAPVASAFSGDATFSCETHVDNASSSLLARRSLLGSRTSSLAV
ncbi:hypothetical protein HPB51_015578 [Rhipicephalus microplus]|uniref:Secreted protein n=1 Tax=Rhipicephalus microplus TaxID=6941 RepID=A0A9J6DHI0_RHIMP|nr:hypothetical protein HPB51_015578 [Rhipicephalus microplus]